MCLINSVYPLAPVPLVSVVKFVFFGALFCCSGLLGEETFVAKTKGRQFSGL